MTEETARCLFATPDGIICTSCDHPPDNSTYIGIAPEGTPEGPYRDPGKLPKLPSETE